MSAPSSVARSGVPSAPKAGEDLPPDGVVPVAEGVPDRVRCDGPGTAAENLVVTAEEDGRILRVRERPKPRIWLEVGGRPLPDVADHLLDTERAGPGGERSDGGGMSPARPEIRPRPVGRGIPPGEAPDRAPGCRRRGLLPLGLGRKTPPRPARERVRLVPAHVDHRLVETERLPAAEPPSLPPAARVTPEQRVLESFLLSERPSRVVPIRPIPVSAVIHEREEPTV